MGLFPVDPVRPYLTSGGEEVAWGSGGPAYLVASSSLVRVNVRGVHTRPPQATVRDLAALGWAWAPCNVSWASLCKYPWGDAFPGFVPRSTDDRGSLPPSWVGLACGRGEGKLVLAQATYDLSACDVLDEGSDVVYSRGRVFVGRTMPSPWLYWALVLLAVFLVRGLGRNVRAAHTAGAQTDRQWPVVAGCALVVCLASLAGDSIYATEEDRWFYWATVAYVAAYAVYHAGWAVSGVGEPPVFNLVAGALQLVAVRLYAGAETPYNPVVVGIITARTWSKILSPSPANACTALADGAYLALACDLAFLPDPAYLIALFLACYLASRVMFVRIQ